MSTAPRYQPRYTFADSCQWEGDWELWNGTADKDRTSKRALYEATGVAHYLLVDPATKTIEWLALGDDGAYHDQSAEVDSAPTFAVTLADGRRIEIDRRLTFA